MSDVSFATNIKPVFQQYKAQMIWRFDLTSYEDVKASVSIIKERVNSTDPGDRMPPPPFPAFDQSFIEWVDAGCPP